MKIQNFFLGILFYCILTNVICIDLKESDFINLELYKIHEVKITPKNKQNYFKYENTERRIVIEFSLAKLTTEKVLVYDSIASISNNNTIAEYFVHENMSKEINVGTEIKNIYIIIQESNNKYYFKDYIRIVEISKEYELKPGTPLNLKKFYGGSSYKFTYNPQSGYILYFSSKESKNKLIIKTNLETKIYEDQETIKYSPDETNEIINIEISAHQEEGSEFSIIVYDETKNIYNSVTQEFSKISYLNNNETQEFYFYSNIQNYNLPSAFNFVLKPKYLNDKTSFTFYYKNIDIDPTENIIDKIKQSTFENSISRYDDYLDNFYYVYFNPNTTYIVIKLEINIKDYIIPEEFSFEIKPPVKEEQTNPMEDYKTYTIIKEEYKNIDYKIPLDSKSTYILGIENRNDIKIYNGDLLTKDKSSYNNDTFTPYTEMLKIENKDELTLSMGPLDNKVYLEKVKSNDVLFSLDERQFREELKVEITQNDCDNNITKYVLCSYKESKEDDDLKLMNIYATSDESSMEIFHKNFIKVENESLFPKNNDYKYKLNKVIQMGDKTDFFSIKSTVPGTVRIIPQYVIEGEEDSNMILQNYYGSFKVFYNSIIKIQLSVPINKKEGQKLYLTILLVNPGIVKLYSYEDDTIPFEELNEEKPLLLQCIDIKDLDMYKSYYNLLSYNYNEIEITEVVTNKNTDYTQVFLYKEYTNINYTNLIIQLDNLKDSRIVLNFENINEDKKIYYNIIKFPTNDFNYIPLPQKFKNYVQKKITKGTVITDINNPYYHKIDSLRPYTYFLLSFPGEQTNLNYNLKFVENLSSKDYTAMIIVGTIVGVIIIVAIILIIIIILKQKRVKLCNKEDQLLVEPIPALAETEDVGEEN